MDDMTQLDTILTAIESAEWRGRDNESHWRRTEHAPKEGSSAFGPYQITRDLVRGALKNNLLSEPSAQFAQNILIPMQNQFLKYGKEPLKPGYTPEFDYGGTGNFDAKSHGTAYLQLARELLAHELGRNSGDVIATLEAWRGRKHTQDPEYFKAALKTLEKSRGK